MWTGSSHWGGVGGGGGGGRKPETGIIYTLEVQVDYFLNGFSRKDYCFSRDLQSTIQGDYSFYGLGLPGYIYILFFLPGIVLAFVCGEKIIPRPPITRTRNPILNRAMDKNTLVVCRVYVGDQKLPTEKKTEPE